MSWFNVDDKLADSPEVLVIPKRFRLPAIGLWSMGGAWLCNHMNAELFVPDVVWFGTLGGTTTLVGHLCHAGYLQSTPGGALYTLQGCRVTTLDKAQKTRSATAGRVQRHRSAKEKPPDQHEPPDVTVLHPPDVTPLPGTYTNTNTNPKGWLERAPYVGEGRGDGGSAQDDVWEMSTAERTDLSPPVTVGASRLVDIAIKPNVVNSATRTALRIESSALLVAGETEDDVAEALRLWLTKPDLGPRALKALMAEVYKKRLPHPAKPPTKLRAAAELAQEIRAAEQSQQRSIQ